MEQNFLRRLQQMQTAFQKNPRNEDLRSDLQNYFDDLRTAEEIQPQIGALTREALLLLRRFRNAQPPSPAEPEAAVDLTSLCEDLAFACDLLCDGQKKRIYCTDTRVIFGVCRPRAVLWAVLNLLTNAVQYADGRYIFIGTSETAQHIRISVSCAGDFPIPDFRNGLLRTGGGLWYADKTARLHSGQVLLTQSDTQNTVSLTLARRAYTCARLAETDFTDWLADSLSPVYTAFCEICTPSL